MSDPGVPSFDQLSVFLTVVETGSFAAAGRRLHRATSAISYAIANAELQLGVALFDREKTRKPTLTDAGRAVLAKARAVAAGMDDLRACVSGLLEGLEAEVSFAVDVMFPTERLTRVVKAFDARFPTVKLRLHVEALGAVPQLVSSGGATLAIGGGLHIAERGLTLLHAGSVAMLPVASPAHPLARKSSIAAGEARRYRQLVLTVRSPYAEGSNVGVFAEDVWHLADLGAKHALLLAGLGWGSMPEPMIAADLASGRLVRLVLPEGTGVYPFQGMYRPSHPPGPAGRWLLEQLVASRDEPSHSRRRRAGSQEGTAATTAQHSNTRERRRTRR